jgi:hypothetical protein
MTNPNDFIGNDLLARNTQPQLTVPPRAQNPLTLPPLKSAFTYTAHYDFVLHSGDGKENMIDFFRRLHL